MESTIIQVSNVAPQANKEQMQTLFGYIGKVEDLRLYPTLRDVTIPVQVRICFIKFSDAVSVAVAQHISNTVFIDRALIVAPYMGAELPDEIKGLEILNTGNGGIIEPKLPPTLTNQVEGVPPHQFIRTIDPRLAIHNLPTYPLLPASTDARRLEEIRRTLVIMNIDPALSAAQVIDFFSTAGEVKYFRMCSRESDNVQYGLIEFVEQETVVPALKLNNKQMGDRVIKVHHSTQAIIKPLPQNKSNEAAQKEIEEAVNRAREEAQQSILTATSSCLVPEDTEKEKEKEKEQEKDGGKVKEKEKEKETKKSRSRSKSRSKSRRRSSSRSRRRRSRSRKRSRSRSRKRSRSRSRSKSKSRDRRKKSRSRSRDRRKRSRSRDRRRRSRSRSRSRKSPRRSRDRRDRSKDRTKDKDKSKDKSRDKDKGRDKEKKDRDKDKDRKERKEKKKERKERVKSPNKDSSDEKEHERSRKSKSRSPSKSKSRRRSRSTSRGRSR